jgi:hypothetical protein
MFAQDLRANQQFDANVLLGIDSFSQVAAPRGEPIDPSQHGEFVSAQPFDDKRALPPIVQFLLKVRFPPRRVGLMAIEQSSAESVMAIGENSRTNFNPISDDALRCESALIDLRRDLLDQDSAATDVQFVNQGFHRFLRWSAIVVVWA